MEITLQEILEARERRVQRQNALLSKYGLPIICFTMNIAGPEKCNDLVKYGFELGHKWLLAQLSDLKVVHTETYTEPTGCEGFYVVDASAQELKRRAVQVEDYAPVARLFDMDVLDANQQNIENYHVIIVEDIIDTGRTLNDVVHLLKKRNPLSLHVMTLLDKPSRRIVDFKADFSLFTIEDLFVIGYGLDCSEYYRNLPYIAEYDSESDV